MIKKIPVGTMVRCNGGKGAGRVRNLKGLGFECIQLHWWASLGDENLTTLSVDIAESWGGTSVPVSALALYGNPLRKDSEGQEALRSIRALMRSAEKFNCRTIGLFTGRRPGTVWDASLPVFREVFSELCREASDLGLHLAMENCPMGGDDENGDWNLAYHPLHWRRLLESLPSSVSHVLGLEWEPAHQIVRNRNPFDDLPEWSSRIFHVHGKDARRLPDGGGIHVLPGNGETDWSRVFQILADAGYAGSVDIEGYHDPEWSGDREIPGQVNALKYLKASRDGQFSGSRRV